MERMKQAAAELRELYDQDKDGQLSADEKAFMERDLAEADRKARLSRDYMRIKAVDVDGNLVISPEEEAGSQQRLREDARNRIEALQRQRARQAEQQQKPDTKAPAPAAPAPAAPAPAAPAPAAE
ncbi:MAG: hypothetical protein PHC30_00110 [Lentisphaeria bacterium]|nr:hypothetical protein [Lentisphaeria bacterium]